MLNLGTLLFGLGVDTRGLDAARQRVEQFGRTVQGAQTAANRGFETSIAMLRRQENALLSGLGKLRTLQDQINRTTLAPNVKADALQRLNAEWAKLSQRITSSAAGLDTTKIDRAVASFNQAGSGIMKTFQGMDRASRETAAAVERQVAAVFRAQEAAKNLGSRIQQSNAPGLGLAMSPERQQLTGQLEAAYQRFRAQMAQPVSTEAARRFQREWTAALNDVQRKFREMGGAIPAASALESWRRGLRGLGDSMLLLHGHLGGLSTRFFALSQIVSQNGFKFGAAAAGVVSFAAATKTLFDSAVKSRLVLEKMTMALTSITGNSTAAALAVDYVRTVSDRAGISIEAVAQSYARLTASGQAAGFSQKQLNRTFEVFAQASGRLALSAEDTQGVMRALDQIMSKGTVQAEELRGQLGDRLPAAFALAAQSMGVTTRELTNMMKKGELLSSEFIPKFTETVAKAFGVNTAQNVETLQASMTRLGNAWLFFGRSVDQTFGITQAYIRVLDTLSGLMNALSANMETVVGVVGGLAGAMAGLAVVMIAPTLWAGIAAGATAVAGAFAALRTVTVSLTGAQMALYALMATTPWGRIITLVVQLTAVIAGAAAGFGIARNLAADLQSSLADTSGIEQYITGQRKALTATLQTTQAMMNQIMLMGKTAASEASAAGLESARIRQGGVGQYARDLVYGAQTGQWTTRQPELRRQRLGAAEQRATEAIAESRRLMGLYQELEDISKRQAKLPDAPTGGVGADGDGSKKAKGVDEWANALERADEMVRKLKDNLSNANLSMDMLFSGAGTPDFRAVDALMEARQQIQGLSDVELKALKTSMGDAGMSTEDLTARIASLIGQTNEAKDAVAEFTNIWQSIEEGQRKIKDAETAIQFLTRGGDSGKMWLVDATNEAYTAIDKLTKAAGANAPAALEALRRKLEALGFVGRDAADALAQFMMSVSRMEHVQKAVEDIGKAWAAVAKETYQSQILAEAYAHGTAVGQAAERILAMADKVAEFRENMELIYGAGSFVDQQVADFADSLAGLDRINESLQRTQQRMADLREIWDEGFRSMYSNMMDVARGTKTIWEGLTDSLLSIVEGFAQKAVDILSEAGWNALFGDPTQIAAALVGGAKRGGNAAGAANIAAARSVNLLAQAATAAATALGRLAAGMPGVGGGGFGGGIFGSILGGLGSIAGGLFGGGGLGGGIENDVLFGNPMDAIFGRASGGPVTRGQRYKVNENGLHEEFTPDVSGWINPGNGSRGGNTIMIDARTTIDARGATEDAIAELRREMGQRDARLRAELPYHIDARTRENDQRLRS